MLANAMRSSSSSFPQNQTSIASSIMQALVLINITQWGVKENRKS